MTAALVIVIVLVAAGALTALLLRTVRHPRERTALGPERTDADTDRLHGHSDRPAGADAEDPPHSGTT